MGFKILYEVGVEVKNFLMGLDGTEYQKCPSIFFILCGYIDHVYIYLYMEQKSVTNIVMGFKI